MRCTGLLIGLVFILSLFPQSTAAIIWSDDFETGFDGWNVVIGDWRVVNGYFELYYVTQIYGTVWHASSVVEGTWSFDVCHSTTLSQYEVNYMFMLNGTEVPADYYGYGIRISGSSVYFVRQSGGFNSLAALSFVIWEDTVGTWTHIDVTRNSAGEFNVFFNVTPGTTEAIANMSVTDTNYDYSEKFLIQATGIPTARIDNITVYDEIMIDAIDSTPTTTTTPTTNETPTTGNGNPPPSDYTLLIVGGGVAAVVIIGVVVCLKRR